MGTTIQKIATRYILRAAELILSKYRPLTLECVDLIMLTLNHPSELVYWNNRWTHLDVLALDYQPDTDIRTIPIRFTGGPPGTARLYDGNVWMLIIDRVAREIALYGYEATRDKLRVS